MAEHDLQIRSFRLVFDLERRIHRVDRFRLPLPYGLPLRSLVYGAASLLGILVLAHLPGFGALISGLPAPARYVLLPAGIAYALTQVRLDGRSAHAAATAWIRYRCRPTALVAFRRLDVQPVAYLDQLTCFYGERSGRRRKSPLAASPDWQPLQTELVAREQMELW